ncbi:MAG: (Fe-S)-binding protein [Ardenticatenia bacterium]|nr:(Fe-S)-binding protein [Ardenticatenia bacterium]
MRNQKIARAFVRLLQEAGVDFAVLGPEESCNGDPARRMGNEYLFQMMAERNVNKLGKYTFKKIVTACPHCFNVLKNEYPQFGGEYEVIHHSELLAELIAQGRLRPQKAVDDVITFHDSCYLGRYNNIFDAPREVLAAVPGVQLREMPRSRERGLCCGGGGAGVWNEPKGKRRVEEIRLEEALGVDPDAVASACPFCMIMFDSGAKNLGVEERVRLRDVAEVLAESVGVEL